MAHVNYIDWHTHPFRAERWLEVWRPALDRALAFGATVCYLTRSIDDPLHFRQISILVGAEDETEGKTEEGPGAIRAEVGA